MSIRATWTLLIATALLLAMPLASSQGPPGDTPGNGGGPQAPPGSDNGGANGTNPGAPGEPGTGRPNGTTSRAAVDIQDAQGGFGARPSDPDARRPAFSYDVGRSAMALERAGVAPMQVVGDALVEFDDENANGAYDVGEPIVQRLALRSLNVTIEEHGDNGRHVVHGLPGGGAMTLRFDLAPGDQRQATKFDVHIRDFPFQGNDTMVALGMRVDVAAGVTPGRVGADAALVGTEEGEVPFLSWVAHAEVDNRSLPVGATVHAGPDGGVVYWTYAAGADILHDPVLGVTTITLDQLWNAPVFAASLAIGGLVMAAGFEARRRMTP